MKPGDVRRRIIPLPLESRFRDLIAFTYECKTPMEALHMVETVFRECGEAVDAYDYHAIEPLVMPAMQAAIDALTSVTLHMEASGEASEAREKCRRLNEEILRLIDEGVSGTHKLPEC